MIPPVPLSALAAHGGFSVVRDGLACSLGFVGLALEGMLTFLDRPACLPKVRSNPAIAAVLTTESLADAVPGHLGLAVVDLPRPTFFRLHNWLASQTRFYGNGVPTVIDPAAEIHASAHVSEVDVRIGPHCRIGPNTSVLAGSVLGAGARVDAGAVIGGEGFQRTWHSGESIDLIHMGRAVLEEGAWVMSNAVIARGVFREETVIGRGTRVGNGAFVSHNVHIGEGCLIGHGAVIAGNCTVSDRAEIGPGATLADRLSIGAGARVILGAVVCDEVHPSAKVSGNFAISHWQHLRQRSPRR